MANAYDGKPPKRLQERHHLLAYLIAAGYNNVQSSAALKAQGIGLTPNRISTIRQHPDFRRLVREIQTSHMGSTVRSVLSTLARSAIPSLKTMDTLRQYAEDDGVKLRAADRLFTAFEKAAGLGVQKEGGEGPLVQINLTTEEHSTFESAIREAQGGPVPEPQEAEIVPQRPALAAPRPKAKTIKELMAELGPCEKYVEAGAV